MTVPEKAAFDALNVLKLFLPVDSKLNNEVSKNFCSSNIGKRVKQSISSESEEQASAYHKDDDSDNELLRLAFERWAAFHLANLK